MSYDRAAGFAPLSTIARKQDKLEERLDGLYRAPPEEFTAARNELASELNAAGDGDAAAKVKQLKRPTQAAWLVNRLSLDHPAEIRGLLEAADRLRQLHGEFGRSESGERLREAAREEREALARLTELARVASGDLPPAPALDRVAETLQAAASDEETARVVSRGRLDRERRAASLTGGRVAAPTRAATKPPSKARARELKEARATLKRLQRRAKQLLARRDREREARKRAEAKLGSARAALESTEEELAGLEDEIADNERLLTRLER